MDKVYEQKGKLKKIDGLSNEGNMLENNVNIKRSKSIGYLSNRSNVSRTGNLQVN